jgi:NAD(P)-dependent dehydrogenase (short-subunit alcohol dehydrogenase family)
VSRAVLVTGASRGIGAAVAGAFAGAGDRGAVHYGASRAAAEQVVAALPGEGHAVVQAELADPEAVRRMVDEAADRLGGIDVLVNNAAIFGDLKRLPFEGIDPDDWDRVMAVNAKGPWLCTAAVAPQMRRRGGGSVVNIASATFFSGSPLLAHYVASKGAVIALTRSLARELGEHRIRVNAVAPGFTMTEASRHVFPDAENYAWQKGALARPEQPEDVAGAVVFLASDASAFITGQCLVVDGGRQFH